MKTPDAFAAYPAHLIEAAYDCVDRLVVNCLGVTAGNEEGRMQKFGSKPPRGHPQAIWWPTGRHPEATLRLPSGYPEATPRLPWAANGGNGLPSLGTRGASRSRQYGFPFLGLTTTCWSLFGD